MRLKDKIGIVTAAGSGMGRAGAIRFAKEGAKVAVVDLDGTSVDAVVKEITAAGGKAIGITADLREDANAKRIVRETANAFGGLDFVWNHLGHPGPASVEGIDMADFALAVDLNLRSQIVTTEAALPELKERDLPRRHRHADAARLRRPPRPAEYPGPRPRAARRPARRPEPDGPPGAARGDRQRGAVFDLGRGVVHHGRGVAGGWRDDGVKRWWGILREAGIERFAVAYVLFLF